MDMWWIGVFFLLINFYEFMSLSSTYQRLNLSKGCDTTWANLKISKHRCFSNFYSSKKFEHLKKSENWQYQKWQLTIAKISFDILKRLWSFLWPFWKIDADLWGVWGMAAEVSFLQKIQKEIQVTHVSLP